MSESNPWDEFDEHHHRDERLTSTISRIVSDIGLFVALDGGIDGIVHLNDLDWESPGDKEIESYSVGDTIEVVILSIEPERERVSLGIKQLKPDPRPDRDGQPPAPAPVRPRSPKPPKPLSEAAEY